MGESTARTDLDGEDLFALVGALAWLRDQPSLTSRVDHLFDVILTDRANVNADAASASESTL